MELKKSVKSVRIYKTMPYAEKTDLQREKVQEDLLTLRMLVRFTYITNKAAVCQSDTAFSARSKQ